MSYLSPHFSAQIFTAPFGAEPVPESEWVEVTDGASAAEETAWSVDGTILYFVSEADGNRCLYGQRLDLRTRAPQGEPVAILHSHESARTIVRSNLGPQNIDATSDAVYISMQEFTGNIWMVTLER